MVDVGREPGWWLVFLVDAKKDAEIPASFLCTWFGYSDEYLLICPLPHFPLVGVDLRDDLGGEGN